MDKKLGTPNQKALYSRLGLVTESCADMLETLPEGDTMLRLQIMDRLIKSADSMNKAYGLELLRAKIGNANDVHIRMIEQKDFEL